MKKTSPQRRNPIRTKRLDCLTTMGMGVAHDFNNLLAAIQGNVLVAQHSLPGDAPAAENLAQIDACAARGLEMTSRILTFTGRAPFVPAEIRLPALIRTMQPTLNAFGSEAIAIDYRLHESTPPIPGDAAQIRALLIELVTNASEALIERNGVIRIETGRIECDREYLRLVSLGTQPREGSYAYLDVSDDGKGISKRTQALMFDPFFTTKLRGQGLGLCVVVGVLRAHRGALEVWSRAYKGSRFRALFPVAPTAPER